MRSAKASRKAAAADTRYVSKGLTRSRTDRLKVMEGRHTPPLRRRIGRRRRTGGANVTAFSSGARARIAGATALKSEPEQRLSPTQELEHLQWTKAEARTDAKAVAAERRAEAKAKGYEGEMCGECLNFTLVRNGTCMKCETCGSTTGCSAKLESHYV